MHYFLKIILIIFLTTVVHSAEGNLQTEDGVPISSAFFSTVVQRECNNGLGQNLVKPNILNEFATHTRPCCTKEKQDTSLQL